MYGKMVRAMSIATVLFVYKIPSQKIIYKFYDRPARLSYMDLDTAITHPSVQTYGNIFITQNNKQNTDGSA